MNSVCVMNQTWSAVILCYILVSVILYIFMNCLCVVRVATGSVHVEQPEATTWSEQKATRGTTRIQHVVQKEQDKWLDQNRTRGSTWSRHMAPPEHDTWHDQKTTCGATGSRHVASREVDTWLCQRGSSLRQLPVWHVPRGSLPRHAVSVACAT